MRDATYLTVLVESIEDDYALVRDEVGLARQVRLDLQRAKGAMPKAGETWIIDRALGFWSFAAIIGYAGAAEAVEVPVPDNLADAMVLEGAYGTVKVRNTTATEEAGERTPVAGDQDPGTERSLWFKWQAPFTGGMQFDTLGSYYDPPLEGGSWGLDTVLEVFAGAAPGLTLENMGAPIASSDDSPNPYNSLNSLVTVAVVLGNVYSIRVTGYSTDEVGVVFLNWHPAVSTSGSTPTHTHDGAGVSAAVLGHSGAVPTAGGSSSVAAGPNASAAGDNAIAIGNGAVASGYGGIAMGVGGAWPTTASASDAVAIGVGAKASAGNAIAIGFNMQAQAAGVVCIGQQSRVLDAGSDGAIAIGVGVTIDPAGCANAIAIGSNAIAGAAAGLAVGQRASATGESSLAMGSSQFGSPITQATSTGNIAIGSSVASTGDVSLAMGWWTTASGTTSIAIGSFANASGSDGTAIGNGAAAAGWFGLAIGGGASAPAQESVAIGGGALASGLESVAIGAGTHATGALSIGLGYSAFSTSDGAIAIGSCTYTVPYTRATGSCAVAIGAGDANRSSHGAYATNYYATAVGYNTTASGQDSTALGSGASATHLGATAIGYSATTTANNQIMLGTSTNAVAIPGKLSVGGAMVPTPPPFSMGGALVAATSGRWYAPAAAAPSTVRASLGTAGTTTTTVVLMKNGADVATLNLTSGVATTTQGYSTAFAAGDYFQVRTTAVGTGATDLTVQVY